MPVFTSGQSWEESGGKRAMFCPYCGTKLDHGARFCKHCGVPIDRAEPSTFKKREQEYAGKMIKCPACGEDIPSFTAICPSCGHEIRGSGPANSIQELSYKLEHTSSDSAKANLIRTFPIPNTREDILEFMILASTNIENSYQPEVSEAWAVKFEQAFEKSKILYGDDQKILDCYNLYLNKREQFHQRIEHEQKRACSERRNANAIELFDRNKRWILPVCGLIACFILTGLLSIPHMIKEFQLENLVKVVEASIEEGDFEAARRTANQIIYDIDWSDESKQKWDLIRESLLESITRQEVLAGKKIYAGFSSKEAKGKSYSEVADYFERQGFTNIQIEEIKDLITGWWTTDGEVEKVTINGLSEFEEESVFEPDAEIVIFYHTF